MSRPTHLEKFFYGLLLFIALYSILLLLPPATFSSEEFETTFTANYIIGRDGKATVRQQIELKNKLSNIYATQYALEIGSTRIQNVNAFTNSGSNIPFEITQTDNKTAITLAFQEKVVGKNQSLKFTVQYQNLDSATLTGKVLEVNVPKIANHQDIEQYSVNIYVPQQFGQPTIVSPDSYTLGTDQLTSVLSFTSFNSDQSITAIYGDHQIFEFDFKYHLENRTVSNAIAQVALPPDTPYQKIYYDLISPRPESIELDSDGNWIANFILEPKQQIDLSAQGSAVLYLKPTIDVPNQDQNLKSYLLEQKYWEVKQPDIKSLANKLKDPERIYNHLVDQFSYNYERIDIAGTNRLGAEAAINNPSNAICTEFTDSFVALARAAGIPTRELNGFAYTENSKLRPLSLVEDVLHAWPEYWNSDKKIWIPIDPTWGNTTGGIDYFNHLDFNHFVFAIHGSSSETPYPVGYYKLETTQGKDVNLNFSSIEPQPSQKFNIDFTIPETAALGPSITATITIDNQSNQAFYNQPLSLKTENYQLLSDDSINVPILLPFSDTQVEVKLKPNKLLLKESGKIYITFANRDLEYEINALSFISREGFNLIVGGLVGFVISSLAYRAGSLLVSFIKKRSSLRRKGQEFKKPPQQLPPLKPSTSQNSKTSKTSSKSKI